MITVNVREKDLSDAVRQHFGTIRACIKRRRFLCLQIENNIAVHGHIAVRRREHHQAGQITFDGMPVSQLPQCSRVQPELDRGSFAGKFQSALRFADDIAGVVFERKTHTGNYSELQRFFLASVAESVILEGMIRFLALFLLACSVEAAPSIADFANVTTQHYQVFAQSGPQMASQVNGYMTQMLALYSRYFMNWTPKDGARVVVFSNRDDFREYSRGAIAMTHPSLAGYCHLKTDEDGNTFFELVTYEQDRLWQVLAHEGFHQFIGYELGAEIPVWLNEGMAQYFENCSVKYGKLMPGGIDPTRLALAQMLMQMKRAPAVRELLSMDKTNFYANADVTYPTSWALVYYLMTRDGTYYMNNSFRHYLQDLKFSQDSAASFRRRFGRDSAQWQQDFYTYILKLRPPTEN